MDTSTWAVVLLLLGMLILIAEVFIPSGGLMTVAAVICLGGAITCAWMAWWESRPQYFWWFLSTMAVVLPSAVGIAFMIWPHTALGKQAILEGPRPEDVASFPELEAQFAKLPGRLGETLSVLNPAGIVRIDEQRIHCTSEGMIIDPGVVVRVLSVQGNRVVVRQAPPGTELSSDPESRLHSGAGRDQHVPPENDAPLDFEIT